MHNSIWRQEKVTPAAQATETAHTYVMSHFVMPRHAPSACRHLRRRETRDKAGADDAFFNYLRARPPYNRPLASQRIPHRNDQLGWFSAISRWRVGDLNLERMLRWEILPSNQNRGPRS
jgi:hypothetical protein